MLISSWVAGFAIEVVKNLQIILKPCNVWKVHYCGIFFWQPNFDYQKTCVCILKKTGFSWTDLACLPFQKRIRSLIKPLLKNKFSTSFQGTDWAMRGPNSL